MREGPGERPALRASGLGRRAGSGRDLSQLDFYVALGYWKLVILLEEVFARCAAGQYGEPDEGFEQFAKVVERLADAAAEAKQRLA